MTPKLGERYVMRGQGCVVEDVKENGQVIARYDWWGITIWKSLEDWHADRQGAEPEKQLYCIINCGREALTPTPQEDLKGMCPGPKCQDHSNTGPLLDYKPTLAKHMTLSPAYGRDYVDEASALRDWEADKDFIICTPGVGGKYINKQQAPEAKKDGFDGVRIRFNNLDDCIDVVL